MNIQSINSNNNCSFKQFKGMKYTCRFNPTKNLGDARAVLSFNKSDAFKNFFEKFDGKVEFSRVCLTRGEQASQAIAYLDVYYKEAKQSSFIDKCINTLKKIISNEPEYSVFQISVLGETENLSKELSKIIRMFSFDDLMHKINHKNAIKNKTKEYNEALARVNEEISKTKW